MKLFRLRFILLGLLLCVFHVWCRTCGTEFADPGSSAYLAQVVILGVVSQKLPPSGNRYNVTVQIEGKDIKKGKELLKKVTRTSVLRIGEFGHKDLEDCVDELKGEGKYYFFLNVTSDSSFFRVSALPLGGVIPKKIRREIEKISQCKMDDSKCVTVPAIKTKMKNSVIEVNKQVQLQCNLKKTPVPKAEFIWLKDGEVIRQKKGIQIKHGKKGSRLRIRHASLSDEGNYACIIRNVAGSVKQEAVLKIAPERKRSCGKDYEGYCMNNGTCLILSELEQMYCECQLGYTGQHCGELIIPPPIAPSSDLTIIFDEIRNIYKLNHERTLIIIGIIVGILAFIGMCIASYFLAKRRQKLFCRRREETKQTIEDYIPQVYRPLLSGCDEVDGPCPKINAPSGISKETQTTESSFSIANGNLYVNPLDGLQFSPSNKINRDRLTAVSPSNKINRDRLTAVSLEGFPRPENGHGRVTSNSDQNPRHSPNNMSKEGDKERSLRAKPPDTPRKGDLKGKEAALKASDNEDPEEKDPLSPKTSEREHLNEQMSSPVPHFSLVAVGNPHERPHSPGDNDSEDAIRNHTLPSSHDFNFDTESDSDEASQNETPLPPLYISEEEFGTEGEVCTITYYKDYGLDELENLAVENEQNNMSPNFNDFSSNSRRSFSSSLGDTVKSQDSTDKSKPMDRNVPLKYGVLDPPCVSSHFWNERGSLEQGMATAGLDHSQEEQCKHDQKQPEYFQSTLPFSSNNFGEGSKLKKYILKDQVPIAL